MSEAISVIIPTYNRSAMIGRAIESALSQILPEDEIIVVDDGSTDGTADVLGPYKGKVIYLYQENAGPGAARNLGIRTARHDLIAFLDSDDEWQAGKLDKQRALMSARSDIVLCCTDFSVLHADNRVTEHFLARWHRDKRSYTEIYGQPLMLSEIIDSKVESGDIPVHIGDIYYDMMKASYVFTTSSIVRRSIAGQVFYFEEGINIYEDWACFGRLAGAGPTAFIDSDLALNHGHTEGRLTDVDNYPRSVARIIVLEEVWGKDSAFLAKYKEQYEAILQEQRIIKAGGLLSEGRVQEAKIELSKIENPPRMHTIMSTLRGPICRLMFGIRHLLKSMMGK